MLFYETKERLGRIEKVAKKLGFDHFDVVEAREQSGGLLWLWKVEVELEIVWKSTNIFCCTVKDHNKQDCWRLYGIYEPPRYTEKRIFWTKMVEWITNKEFSWMMFRDLNKIIDESKRLGGRDLKGRCLFLKEFMHATEAIDLGYFGRRFTWMNKQVGTASIRRRLDRAVSSSAWLSLLPKTTMQHLTMEESNHVPILIRTNREEKTYNQPFRFL